MAAGSTEPPRWTCSSVSSSPSGCPRVLGALLSGGWPPDAAAPARAARPALGVLAPDHLTLVVGGRDLQEPVPDLGAAQLLLRQVAREPALEHEVTVVRRPHDLPAVLGEQVQESRDLGQAPRRLGDVLAQPA